MSLQGEVLHAALKLKSQVKEKKREKEVESIQSLSPASLQAGNVKNCELVRQEMLTFLYQRLAALMVEQRSRSRGSCFH